MASSTTMPLRCYLCPKKPKFSDVSHLLTHVTSKGHLSQQLKVKLRSVNDQVSRELLATYDKWYSDWNIEELTAERLEMKEKKKAIADADKKTKAQAKAQRKQQPILSTFIDPSLSTGSPDLFPFHLNISKHNPFILSQSCKPRMHLWDTSSPSSFMAIPIGQYTPPQPIWQVGMDSRCLDNGNDILKDGEETKLKGVLWPGMDVFDAATPDTKRKRNQKKCVSVVEQLEQNADEVQPTEMIFTPTGTLKKSRLITGQVDWDSSPLKGEVTTPPPTTKRRGSGRPPLTSLDVNTKQRSSRPTMTPFRPFPKLELLKSSSHGDISTNIPRNRKTDFKIFKDDDGDDRAGDSERMRYLNSGFEEYPQAKDVMTNAAVSSFVHEPTLQNPPFQTNEFVDDFPPLPPNFFSTPYFGYFGVLSNGMSEFLPYTTISSYPQSVFKINEREKEQEDEEDNNTISAKSEES